VVDVGDDDPNRCAPPVPRAIDSGEAISRDERHGDRERGDREPVPERVSGEEHPRSDHDVHGDSSED
jgi:hypothetical protein